MIKRIKCSILVIILFNSCGICKQCNSEQVYEYVKENFIGSGDPTVNIFPPIDETQITVDGNNYNIKATAEYRNRGSRTVYYHLDYLIKCTNGKMRLIEMNGSLE